MRLRTIRCLVCCGSISWRERTWQCGRCLAAHHAGCVGAHDRCGACGGALLAVSREASGLLTTVAVVGVFALALLLSWGVSGPRMGRFRGTSYGVVVRRR